MAAVERDVLKEKEESVTSTILLPPPTPYEYALISEAAYSDDLPSDDSILNKQGWQRIVAISEETGYCGSLWIHESQKQIVIAHRGSQNAASWFTDIESVIQRKPGTFIHSAIALMNRPEVLAARKEGYRVSTTGHSLGGFLAQVCVYLANRSDFPEIFYPDMSAIVFDSPGAVEFLKVIQSNIKSEKARIKIEHLNIHNFCAMPTVVSTYGTPTGTIWHVANSEACFLNYDALTAHKMGAILAGFNPETGQPYYFRAMRDWPQADYSSYENFEINSETVKAAAVKAVLDSLNLLYKYVKEKLGYTVTPTFYDQVDTNREGQVSVYFEETKNSGRKPELNEFNQRLTFALHAHYMAHPLETDSKKRIDIHHFDRRIQQFLEELDSGRIKGNILDWKEQLQEQYGPEGYALLQQCRIERQGEKVEVVLSDDYENGVFDFQKQLYTLLNKRGVILFDSFFHREVNGRFQAIEKRLIKPPSHLASTIKSTIANLVPREQILIGLNSKFATWPNGGAVALTGPRGAGKTQMARYWCHEQLKNTKDGLALELDASNADILLSQYKSLGSLLGIQWEDKSTPEDIQIQVKNALLKLEHDGLIILFDNAPNYDTVQPYLLPPSAKKSVYSLITSYNTANFTNANEIETVSVKSEFTPEEAIQYIKNTWRKRTGREVSEAEAEKLAKLVYRHPLALTQAVNYILQSSTITEFCEKYERYKSIALKKGLTGNYNESILTITHFAVDRLSESAKSVLYFCSFLHSTNIPKTLLEKFDIPKSLLRKIFDIFNPLLEKFTGEENIEQLSTVIDELQAFSLLTRCDDISGNMAVLYELHGLTQEVVREHILNEQMQRDIILKAIATIDEEYPERNPSMEDVKRRINLISHMQSLLQHSERVFSSDGTKNTIQLPLLLNLADIYTDLGDAPKQKNLLECALPILEAHYGNEHWKVATTLVNLTNAHGALGDPHKQKNLLKRALAMQEAHYGKEHPQVAIALGSLANAHGALGDPLKQKNLLKRTLTILETHYGKEHPQVAITLGSLANAHGALGDPRKQKNLLERALAIEETHYGKEHPQVATTLVNLANAHGALGDPLKQKNLLEYALAIQEAHYGKEHWRVATTLVNLANAQGDLGYTAEAKELLERALAIQETYYSKEHWQVAITLVYLGNAHGDLGDANKKKDLLERALPILEAHYGKEHPQVAIALGSLANAHGDLGDAHTKKILLERALAIQEAHYGKEHWQVAITLENLANAHGALGDAHTQKTLLERALTIQKAHYGKEHWQVARTLTNLANAHGALGDARAQKDLLERTLTIQEAHYGKEHPQVAMILVNLANAHEALGDANKKKCLLEHALLILEAYYGREHPQVTTTLVNLANVHGALGDALTQKNLLERALAIKEAHYGKEHPQVAITLFNLGIAKKTLDDTESACKDFNKAYSIFLQHFGENHPNTKIAKDNLENYCPDFFERIFGRAKAEENVQAELPTMLFNANDVKLLSKDEQPSELNSTLGTLSLIGAGSLLYSRYRYNKKAAENTWDSDNFFASMSRSHSGTPIPFPASTTRNTINTNTQDYSVLPPPPGFFSRRALPPIVPARLTNLAGTGRVGLLGVTMGAAFYGGWQMMQQHKQSKLLSENGPVAPIDPKMRKGGRLG